MTIQQLPFSTCALVSSISEVFLEALSTLLPELSAPPLELVAVASAVPLVLLVP